MSIWPAISSSAARKTGNVAGAISTRSIVRWTAIVLIVALLAVGCRRDSVEDTPVPSPEPTQEAPAPTLETAAPEVSNVVDLIAYVGIDSNIYTIRPDGTDEQKLTFPIADETGPSDREMIYNWPTWSPDSTQIAYSGFEVIEEPIGSLYLVDVEGGLPKTVFENQPDAAGRFVANRSPHYILWSPDSRNIAFLAPTLETLVLLVIDAEGAQPPHAIAVGAPSYLSWSPDSKYILHHLGRGLGLVDGSFEVPSSPLPVHSLAFRAPSWSYDSQTIAFTDQVNNVETLQISNFRGSNEVTVTTLRGLSAFAWSPTANELAYTSITPNTDLGVFTYNGLNIFDADTGESRRVSEEEVVSFFWSPDGEKIAYVAVDRLDLSLAWHVVDRDGKSSTKLTNFIPGSEMLLSLFAFFDQYSQSNRIWSPDSEHLVYVGRSVRTNGSNEDQVWVLPVDGSAPPTAIASGRLAFWSPR